MLLVHDLHEYFLQFFSAGDSPVVELTGNCVRLVEACRRSGVPVAFTAQPSDMPPGGPELLTDFWDAGTPAEHGPGAPDTVFARWRYSAFFRSELPGFFERRQRDQLIVCGVHTHVGCMVTAIDALAHGIQPFFVADAVTDFTLGHHHLALDYVAGQSAKVLSTEAVLRSLALPVS